MIGSDHFFNPFFMLQQQQLSECFCSKERGGDLHFCDVFERPNLFYDIFSTKIILECSRLSLLTADAWVSGPDLAPQKFNCPKSLGTSWDAKNILKIFFILLSFCKQTAVSQELRKIKKIFKILFVSHEVPKLLGQ